MADAAIQGTVFSENRVLGRAQNDTGKEFLSSLTQARSRATTRATGLAARLFDRYEPAAYTPAFGAERVVGALTRGSSSNGLGNAASLYRSARPQVIRQGLLFNDNDRASPFSTLTADLISTIREDISSANNPQTSATIQQAAQLYRLTVPRITGQAGILPSANLFGTDRIDTTGPVSVTIRTDTDESLNANLSGTISPYLMNIKDLYLSTGYRQFYTPQLLLDIFA